MNTKRLTWKSGNSGYEDVGLQEGVTVGEAICKLADMESANLEPVVIAHWESVQNGKGCCSNCHRLDRIDNLAAYCRYCGARLSGIDTLSI